MRDLAQFRKVCLKLLLLLPCVVSALGVAMRPFLFIRGQPTAWSSFAVGICHWCWFFSPLFAAYILIIALLFMHRRNLRWSAVAFVALGLILQQATYVAVWWAGGGGTIHI